VDNPGVTEEAMRMIENHQWPGNVRELANAIQKTLIFNRGAPVRQEDISPAISGMDQDRTPRSKGGDEAIRQWVREELAFETSENMFDSCMDRFASIFVSEALNLTDGNRSRAAKLLGLSRPTLHSKIEKYGLKLETSVKEEER
jgi:DNA-binding NtrC family response regulator